MKLEYLEFLKCPKCDSESLRLKSEESGERIKNGSLICDGCESTYPIRNSIPRFTQGTSYADSFGPQWRTFATSQIDTANQIESELRFDSELGWERTDIEGKNIIEFGSGAGRFVDVASRRSAHLVVGLDATDAVDAAQDNLSDRDNVFFVQGDIFSSPIRHKYFDYGYSVGVLHHTPDPEASFKILAKVIKVSGSLGLSLYDISLYTRPNRNSLKVSWLEFLWSLNALRCELFRSVTTRVPGNVFLAYCKYFVPILHYINLIPVIRYLRYLFPSTCYKHLPVIWSMVDTHDTYATKIVHQYRGKDLFQWFLHEGMNNIILRNSRAGWVSITGVVCDEELAEQQKLNLEQPGAPGVK